MPDIRVKFDLWSIDITGPGPTEGWATIRVDADQLQLSDIGDHVKEFEVSPTEMRKLRDFLNETFPITPTIRAPASPEHAAELRALISRSTMSIGFVDGEVACFSINPPGGHSIGGIAYRPDTSFPFRELAQRLKMPYAKVLDVAQYATEYRGMIQQSGVPTEALANMRILLDQFDEIAKVANAEQDRRRAVGA